MSSERKIHITLSDDVHQRLRVKCALNDTTIQNYVSQLIAQDVSDVALATTGKSHKRGKAAPPQPRQEQKISKGSKKTRLSKAS